MQVSILHQLPTNINMPASCLANGHKETRPSEEHVKVQTPLPPDPARIFTCLLLQTARANGEKRHVNASIDIHVPFTAHEESRSHMKKQHQRNLQRNREK
jgi:hypothetical protein